jgi:hypothetical protein
MTGLGAYTRSAFERETEEGRRTAADRLKTEIVSRLRLAEEPTRAFEEIVGELNTLGHRLFSWDQDPETGAQTWGPDYTASGSGLVLGYEPPDEVDVSWRK